MEDTQAPYRDASLPTQERVKDLLARMNLTEKLAQLGGVWSMSLLEGDRFSEERARRVLANGTGHITRIAAQTTLGPRDSARLVNAVQGFLVEHTRLGIPAIIHEESCAGYTARGATQFPQAIGLASTWEPELVRAMATVIRTQMVAVGARQTLAPVLDIARDPRWGRSEETYGEDPYLASRMGVAYVDGVQGPSMREGVAATGKHFMGYGAPEAGLNWAPSMLPRRELLERILPPFAAAIREAGLASIMNGYQEIDGVPCGASPWLLSDLLRGELGFDGVVVADYFTVQCLMSYHRIAADKGEAAARALEAGLDVELPNLDCFGDPLRAAVEEGRVAEATVDRAVERLLRMKVDLGLFEGACVDADAAPAFFDTAEQRALARDIAVKSLVLLKNEGAVLPFDPALGRLAVIGPNADSVRHLQGDYHYPTHLEIVFGPIEPDEIGDAAAVPALQPGEQRDAVDLADFFPHTPTILDGIRDVVAANTVVTYERGCSIRGDDRSGFAPAVEAARASDAAIVVVGGRSGLTVGCTSGEAVDRSDVTLSGVQAELLEHELHAVGEGLHHPERAGPARSDPVLHQRNDLPLRPHQQEHDREQEDEGDHHLEESPARSRPSRSPASCRFNRHRTDRAETRRAELVEGDVDRSRSQGAVDHCGELRFTVDAHQHRVALGHRERLGVLGMQVHLGHGGQPGDAGTVTHHDPVVVKRPRRVERQRCI